LQNPNGGDAIALHRGVVCPTVVPFRQDADDDARNFVFVCGGCRVATKELSIRVEHDRQFGLRNHRANEFLSLAMVQDQGRWRARSFPLPIRQSASNKLRKESAPISWPSGSVMYSD